MSQTQYPLPAGSTIKELYLHRSLSEVPVPAAVIDIAKVKNNCKLMLNAIKQQKVSFRAHVKTHKTSELTRLQVGEDCKDVRLIVSTIIEAEHLIPLLLEYKQQGAKVNVLYGVPLGPSHVPRLAEIAKQLGPGSLTVMIDNVAQLRSVKHFFDLTGFPALVFLKTDSGYHRAGLGPMSQEMAVLVIQVSSAEERGDLQLLGFYSHNSLSYGGSSPDDAMEMLKVEIDVCRKASQHLRNKRSSPLTISVGASPTALAIQNISPDGVASTASAQSLQSLLESTQAEWELEIHAGVYPLFDLQQVAATSRHLKGDPHDNIAVTVLAEVCSLYPNRTEKPEALISAGCLALGREPCKDYSGWGVVSSWGMRPGYVPSGKERIIVSRISQEHGILAHEDTGSDVGKYLALEYGQKVRVWPNHACITLSMFGWYLIVDSSTNTPNEITDIWVRWRGW